ncbi:MAG: hypothetical protein ABH835_00655 [Patescibacteria group bacterium]
MSIDKKPFELSEKDALRWGLTHFLDEAANADLVKDSMMCVRIPESEHPFGPMPIMCERRILLVETIGATTTSVETLTRLLAARLRTSMEQQIRYLRVIKLEADKDDQSMHHLFYEVGLETEILIGGGCTDCSGGGLCGKRTMDSLFLLLSTVFEVPIETTDIPFERARSIIASLDARITAYHKE